MAEGVVARSFTPQSLASASSAGLLAWVSGQGRNWQYVWRNRQGKDLGSAGEAGSVVMISPDGKRVLGDHLSAGVWVLDLATGVTTQLGFDAASMNPVWSPDGKYVAWFGRGYLSGSRQRSRGKPAPAEDRSSFRSQELVAGWALHSLCAGQSCHRIG